MDASVQLARGANICTCTCNTQRDFCIHVHRGMKNCNSKSCCTFLDLSLYLFTASVYCFPQLALKIVYNMKILNQ